MKQNSKTVVLAGHGYASDARRRAKANKHFKPPARFQRNPWDTSPAARGAFWYYLMARRIA